MRIDEITDLEKLRKLAKLGRAKFKKDCNASDGSNFIFKAGEWYAISQSKYGLTLYSEEEPESTVDLSYEDGQIYLENIEE